jgi:hypothetical protein
MNVAAMAAITLLIFAEKSLPGARRAAQIGAVILVAAGAVLLLAPETQRDDLVRAGRDGNPTVDARGGGDAFFVEVDRGDVA